MRFNNSMAHFLSYDFKNDAECESFLTSLVKAGMISEYAYVYHPAGLHCEAAHFHICVRQKRDGVISLLSFSSILTYSSIKGSEVDLYRYMSRYDCKVKSNFDFYKHLS